MRGTAVLLAVLLVAGCSGAPPDGTDGDLVDDLAISFFSNITSFF